MLPLLAPSLAPPNFEARAGAGEARSPPDSAEEYPPGESTCKHFDFMIFVYQYILGDT